MYVPSAFAPTDDAVRELLLRHRAADLVTAGPEGLTATMLPFLYDAGATPCAGTWPATTTTGAPADGAAALVIVRGPDAYISPSWYATKAEHGRVVPTWNYVTAHVHGVVTVHDDPAWVAELVRELTDRHEAGRPAPWSVDDAPPKFFAGQLRAIVGVELAIERIEAKFKLSQNRPAADVDGVIEGLRATGDPQSAAAVATHRR